MTLTGVLYNLDVLQNAISFFMGKPCSQGIFSFSQDCTLSVQDSHGNCFFFHYLLWHLIAEKQRSGMLVVGCFEAKLCVFEPMKSLGCFSRLTQSWKTRKWGCPPGSQRWYFYSSVFQLSVFGCVFHISQNLFCFFFFSCKINSARYSNLL